MFADENESLIKQAIKNELDKITKDHGEMYNTLHEGYAVLLEEVEEAVYELDYIRNSLNALWDNIKGDKRDRSAVVKNINKHAINLALEAGQIAAVCEKFQRGTLNG